MKIQGLSIEQMKERKSRLESTNPKSRWIKYLSYQIKIKERSKHGHRKNT